MRRFLTQRLTPRRITVAGWGTILVTLSVCGLGLHLTRLQYHNMSGILLDLEKRSAESARAGLEGYLDERETRVLAAMAGANDGEEPLEAIASKEPLVDEPFLFLSDGTILAPVLGRQPPRPVAAGDEAAPPAFEKAMRAFWSVAPPREKIDALWEVSRSAGVAPAWRLRARAHALALLARSGEVDRAVQGYRELFEELGGLIAESSSPTFLQLAAARADCLASGGGADEARGILDEAFERIERGEIHPSLGEEEFFLRHSRGIFARTGASLTPAAARAERRHQERRLSLAVMETLRDWVFASRHIESFAPDEGKPQHFLEEQAARGEKQPIFTVWSRVAPPPSGPGIAAVGFRVALERLEEALAAGLSVVSPGSRLVARAVPRPLEEGFIDLASLRGERRFIRLGLEKKIWARLVGEARKPFLFAGALIALLMVALALTLAALLLGVKREMALSRMKTELVANVSHELKTPLALIRLFGETLLLGRASDEQRDKYYRIITRESERLTHLISSVLSFASIEAGRKTYELTSCDIGQAVAETCESYRFHLDEQGFAHRLEVSNGLPRVMADPNAVSEAVINLLENAVKYSRERKDIAVDVREEGGSVKVSVADCGVGISPEDQKRVFEDYYRTGEARAMGTRGSGLGLSLVQHILKAHGGRVELSSRPGEGSVFTLVFPAVRGANRSS